METVAAGVGTVHPLHVAYKPGQRVRPVTIPTTDAWERAASDREYHLGPRFYASPEPDGAYRYWPVLDFDDAEDPGRAMREAYRFVRDELMTAGLAHRDDFVLGPSGSKGAKVFLRQLAPADAENAQVWHAYIDKLCARYPTLDAQVAYHATHRGPWSSHPKHPDRLQAMVADPLLMARDSLFVQGLTTSHPRPESLEDSLPRLTPASPAFVRWWGIVGLPWLDRKLAEQRPKARRSYRHRQIDVGALLDAQNVAYQARTAASGREYLRLRACPYCRGRFKAAIMLRSGYLRCYRSGCEADDGISLREWTANLGVSLPAAPRIAAKDAAAGNTLTTRARAPVTELPLFQAQLTLRRELGRRLSTVGDRTTLVRATPGLGKTHVALEALCDYISAMYAQGEQKRVLFAAPTRELAEEAYHRSAEFPIPPLCGRSIIRGRDEDNCEFPRHVAAVGSRGWSPGHAFCAGCPYQTGCDYYTQIRQGVRSSLIFCTHEQAIHLLDHGDLRTDVVVWDEDPTRALVTVWDLTLADVGAVQAAHYPTTIRIAAKLLVRCVELAWSRLEPSRSEP